MSDFEELCEMFGQDASDPEAIDNIVDACHPDPPFRKTPFDADSESCGLRVISQEILGKRMAMIEADWLPFSAYRSGDDADEDEPEGTLPEDVRYAARFMLEWGHNAKYTLLCPDGELLVLDRLAVDSQDRWLSLREMLEWWRDESCENDDIDEILRINGRHGNERVFDEEGNVHWMRRGKRHD